jgi:hypothetical protein
MVTRVGFSYNLPRGITFDKNNNKYKVHCLGKSVGRYLTLDEAITARDKYLGVK